jgi:hypothetical protein
MAGVDALIQKLDGTGKEVFWQGEASAGSIQQLERRLGTGFPDSFRRFLSACGGGGVAGDEISGIESDDASREYKGTVLGDTLYCREQFSLAQYLVVIYFSEDEVVWCLDTSASSEGEEGECPVVSFNVHTGSISKLADTFERFLDEYAGLHAGRA